jgi:acyl-[acyl-carrier-protein]-phospholipid O-acyltransferase/long-chain-fatty-acid--[acyl-carrier-protein] ligase
MLATLLRIALWILFRPRLCGDVRGLSGRGALIVCNHPSVLDGLLLGLFLPLRCTVVVTSAERQHRLMRWLLHAIDHVECDLADPNSLKQLLRLAANGKALVLFPEGRVSRTCALGKLYEVVASAAVKSGHELVPVHLSGAALGRLGAHHHARRLLQRVTLTVGTPVGLAALHTLPSRDRRRHATRVLREAMEHTAFVAGARHGVFEALLDTIRVRGRRTCILQDVRGKKTYGGLLLESLGLGRLVARISGDGENVGVLLPNLAVTVSLFLGMCAMRRVPGMLNYSAGPDAVALACAAAGISTVITSRKFVDVARLHSTVRALDNVSVVYLEDLRARVTVADRLWLLLFACWWPRRAMRRSGAHDPAAILFTSGSEGRPKAVVLSHAAVLANIAQITAVIDVRADDRFLCALPLYHTYGLIACTLLPLINGTRLFLYTTPLHYREIAEIAYGHDCTYLFGTSTFLSQYARHAHPLDFSSLRYVISGGEKLDPQVAIIWLEKFGLRILEGYGATECGPAMTLNSPHSFCAGSVGRFLPGIEHRIVPVPGMSRGGALHVRGPNLMTGYCLPDLPGVLQPPQSDLGAGWFATGDLVEIDAAGFVTVFGRAKRFAKIAGEMISLEAVEWIAARASPAHGHAAIVHALPDRGESTLLFTTDPTLDRNKLHRAATEAGKQDLAVARRVVHVAELPLLGSGKIDYPALRKLAQYSPEGPGPDAKRSKLLSIKPPRP